MELSLFVHRPVSGCSDLISSREEQKCQFPAIIIVLPKKKTGSTIMDFGQILVENNHEYEKILWINTVNTKL